MRQQKVIVLVCMLIFYAISVTNLNSRPVSVDDLDSIKHIFDSSLNHPYSFSQTIQSVSTLSPQHSPGYFVALNAWRALVGDDLFLTRLLSVYFGMATVAFVYRLALLTRNRQVALSAPIAVSLLAYFVFYSQIARMYSLLPLLCSWILWSYWKVVSAPATVGRWKWLSLFLAAATFLYVHYFGAVVLAAIGLYHLLFVPKNRRWTYVTLVLAVAGLSFTLWLPVVFRGYLRSHDVLEKTVLLFPEALATALRIYSNGLWFLPIVAVAFVMLHWRGISKVEFYMLFVAGTGIFLFLVANEITPILVARRMRYTMVLMAPFCCAMCIGLTRIPGWSLLRFPLLVVWIGSYILFSNSHDLVVYTNRERSEADLVPHYQDFVYESDALPGHNELILSFYPHTIQATEWALWYYQRTLSEWAHVAHVSYDDQGPLVVESSVSTYSSLEAISNNSKGIWVIHNPLLTDLTDMPVYTEWFTQQFQFCKRYVEKSRSVIDYYLKSSIPCDLVTDEQPLNIRYSNGTELGNIVFGLGADTLTVYLWWLQTIDKVYSFSLQIFSDEGNKVRQDDLVISGAPIDIMTFDTADLSAGDYTVKLIVYDFETKDSQPGVVTKDQRLFERDVEVFRFSRPS